MKHAFRLSTFNYVTWILPRSKAQATEPTSPRNSSRSETVKTWALALVCCLEQNFDLLVNHLISWKEQKRTLRSPSHKHMPVVFFRHQNVQAHFPAAKLMLVFGTNVPVIKAYKNRLKYIPLDQLLQTNRQGLMGLKRVHGLLDFGLFHRLPEPQNKTQHGVNAIDTQHLPLLAFFFEFLFFVASAAPPWIYSIKPGLDDRLVPKALAWELCLEGVLQNTNFQ